jgi:hypothetical protein
MRSFREKYADDEIWGILKYNIGSEDIHRGCVGFAYLLTMIKEYFFRKYFSIYAGRIVLEEQPYYDFSKSAVFKRSIKPSMMKLMEKIRNDNESICISTD